MRVGEQEMRWRTKTVYPFSAIVGQEKTRPALINPKIGGLWRGSICSWRSCTLRPLLLLSVQACLTRSEITEQCTLEVKTDE